MNTKYDNNFVEHGQEMIQKATENLNDLVSKYQTQFAHYIKSLSNKQLANLLWSDSNSKETPQIICEALARILRNLPEEKKWKGLYDSLGRDECPKSKQITEE